jgi:hypothetical protein
VRDSRNVAERAGFVVMCALLAGCAGASRSDLVTVGNPEPMREPAPIAYHSDPVRISSVWLSRDRMKPGDIVRVRVVTTTNVGAVAARVESIAKPLDRPTYGVFTASIVVPPLPAFLRRSYSVLVTAYGEGANRADVRVPITVE